MNEIQLIKTRVNESNEVIVSARELHDFLEVKEKYTQWFERMVGYGFDKDNDYVEYYEKVQSEKRERTYEVANHAIKIDMAKEIAMIQRSEKGKQARQYFLSVEKAWNSPEKVMERALQFARQKVIEMEKKIFEQKPKVLLAESIENSDDLILIRELAVIIKQNGYNIGQNRLFERLRFLGYLVKKGSSRNMPTQRSMDLGLFRVVESVTVNSKGTIINKVTKVTGKGQAYFVKKFLAD